MRNAHFHHLSHQLIGIPERQTNLTDQRCIIRILAQHAAGSDANKNEAGNESKTKPEVK